MSKASEWAEAQMNAQKKIPRIETQDRENNRIMIDVNVEGEAVFHTVGNIQILSPGDFLVLCRWGIETFGEEEEKVAWWNSAEERDEHLDFSKAVKGWGDERTLGNYSDPNHSQSGITLTIKPDFYDTPVLVVPIKI